MTNRASYFYLIMALLGLLTSLPSNAAINNNPFSPPSPAATLTPLHELTLVIHYANAKKLATLIHQHSDKLQTKRGAIIADSRSNQLWILDNTRHLQLISNFVKAFDTPSHSILINAHIVVIDNHYLSDLGIAWSNPTINTTTGDFNLPITKLTRINQLNVKLSALISKGHAKIISSPQIITNNHHTASIESGEEIPYQEKTGQGNTSIAFKKAVLRLKVTPTLLTKQLILIKLTVNQDKVSSINVNGVPAIATQQLQTQVVLHSRQTIVLGGIYEQLNNQQRQGTFWLSHLPVLGVLFRHHRQSNQRKVLLIFITPSIAHV